MLIRERKWGFPYKVLTPSFTYVKGRMSKLGRYIIFHTKMTLWAFYFGLSLWRPELGASGSSQSIGTIVPIAT